MGLHPLAILLALGCGDEDAVEVAILALEEGLAVLQGLLDGLDHGHEVQVLLRFVKGGGRRGRREGWIGIGTRVGNGVGIWGWEGRVFGAVLDGVGGGEGALEVLEEGFTVGEGDGGDSEGEGVLEVLGVLEVVVPHVVD